MLKLRRRWFVIILVAAVALSGISTVTTGFADELIGQPLFKMLGNSQGIELETPEPPEELTLHTQSYSEPIELQDLSTDGKDNPDIPKDRYNITKEQVDQLLEEGFTIHDLLKADELANIWNIDPLVLLEQKKQTDWLAITNRLEEDKYGPLVEQLKQKHPEAAEQLEGEKLTYGEQLSLLTMIDQYLVPDMNEAIMRFKEKGNIAITEITKENRFFGKVSKAKMEQYGLTQEDVQLLRLTDEKLLKMEQSHSANIPKLLENMKRSMTESKSETIGKGGELP